MTKYRKKPIVIEAIQWDGKVETRNKLGEWLGDKFITDGEYHKPGIVTLEGTMRFQTGDYVIKGIAGEFYPCRKDIFESSYERVEE